MCEDALAFSQYEQGGYLGSPDLSPAVFSTRDHRGADFALPRHAVNSTVPLGDRIRTHVLFVKWPDSTKRSSVSRGLDQERLAWIHIKRVFKDW